MSSKRNGYLFVLTAIVIFTIQDTVSKYLGGLYSPIFITMIRYWAFATFVIVLAARAPGGLRAVIRTRHPVLQCLRGALLALQIVVVITSFSLVGLAYSQAIFASAPILVALLSMPLLGERVGWRRWSAIGAGLCGVLLILKPGAAGFELKILLPLGCAVLSALYAIATRIVARDDSSTTSFFYTGMAGAVAISLIGPFHWTPMAPADWGFMALLCITGTSSHMFLIHAYRMLDATEVQPLTYLQVVLGSAVGVGVFGETLSVNMIVGSVIVVCAGIFTVWREGVLARRQARAARREATPPLT